MHNFSLTQERAFIVFNSLPGKLIFKTLLRSLFITVPQSKTVMSNQNPQQWGECPIRALTQAVKLGPALSSARAGPIDEDPLKLPPSKLQCRDVQEKLSDL